MATDVQKWKDDWDQLTRKNAYGAVLSLDKEYSEEEFRASGKRAWEQIAVHLPRDCKRIVDIGCGAGRVLEFARRRCETAIGIDVSEEMLRLARRRLGDSGFVYAHDYSKIADGSVDFVYSVGVFKHLTMEMIQGHIRECGRVLRRGGIFYAHYYGNVPKNFQAVWIDETDEKKDEQLPRWNRIVPPARVNEFLASFGLTPIEITDWLIKATR